VQGKLPRQNWLKKGFIMNYIKDFKTLRLKDIPTVGGKNASLGQMIADLTQLGVEVPGGFAVTAEAYWFHLEKNGIVKKLKMILKPVTKKSSLKVLQKAGKKARFLIAKAPLPELLEQQIIKAYQELCKVAGKKNCPVAVRSSATAEDLPDASFAGQQETFLNVSGAQDLIEACQKSMASLFTDRAIVYRMEKGFDHFKVALSVGVQHMVRSDKASAGVMFTVDTETGFKDVVVINSAYGLGESVVKGDVVPDEFHVFKTTFEKGKKSLIKKHCGEKSIERVLGTQKKPVMVKKVTAKRTEQFSLTDDEIFELAQYGITIEKHYSKLKGAWSPMDIEWAKDGINGKLYIVQARPETIHASKVEGHALKTYTILKKKSAKLLAFGQSVGQAAAKGRARVIHSPREIEKVKKGDIIVTKMTDPDWVPVMKKAAGIITESGGRTCHAAIVSRELGIPAIVGAAGVLKKIKQDQKVTMDCSDGSEGKIYEGELPITITSIPLKKIKKLATSILVNIAAPDRAYQTSKLPVDGVGLARLEFIITNQVQVHPMACIKNAQLKDKKLKEEIKKLTAGYKNPEEFFIQNVAQGVGTIAAAFFPRPVLVRFSDFKSNEYRNLIGGAQFEPVEENPMIGLRGASRYNHPLYAPAFALECKAIKYAREEMGLTNINVMIPFVRTLTEAELVIKLLKKNGLVSGKDGLKIYMMCEIPSNVILIEEFAKFFDGFSIGSNDLTQTTLSIDRDSGLLASLFDERDPAVKLMLEAAIKGAHKAKRPIGICGQAPSDYPEIRAFLIQNNIDSMSLNPDSVLSFLMK
jgi:pyruvate,water dikinase